MARRREKQRWRDKKGTFLRTCVRIRSRRPKIVRSRARDVQVLRLYRRLHHHHRRVSAVEDARLLARRRPRDVGQARQGGAEKSEGPSSETQRALRRCEGSRKRQVRTEQGGWGLVGVVNDSAEIPNIRRCNFYASEIAGDFRRKFFSEERQDNERADVAV